MKNLLIFCVLAMAPLATGGCCRCCSDGGVQLNDDSVATCGGSAVTIDVLANDTIPAEFAVDEVSIPDPPDASEGTAVVNGNSVVFTPAAGASGDITFYYQVSYHPTDDAANVSQSQAQIIVSISSSTQPPVAGTDTVTTDYNQPALIDVLSNDSDPDNPGGGSQGLSVSNPTQPTNGGTVQVVNNQIAYTPAENYSGPDSFQYTVTDGCGATATGTVNVTVEAPPTPDPAKVLLANNSDFEITVFVGGVQIDVVQPHGSTPIPLDVAAGDNKEVRVKALVGGGSPRVTSNIAKFASQASYTITYSDDNTNPPTIAVEVTP